MARCIALLSVLLVLSLVVVPGCGKKKMTDDEAKTSLQKVQQYIADQDLEEAEKVLKDVEAQKESLSQSLQDQIAAVRMSLDAAKVVKKIQLPKL